MIHPKYILIAHRRAALQTLLVHLQQKHIQSDQMASEPIVCEDLVPYADRVVSQEALYDVEEMLKAAIEREERELRRFRMEEAAPEALPEPKGKADERGGKKRKPGKPTKGRAGGVAQGGAGAPGDGDKHG